MRIKRNYDDISGQRVFWQYGLSFLIVTVFFLLLVYFGLSGPSGIEPPKSWEVDETSVIEWMEKSFEAEQAFERAWKSNPSDSEVFDQLEEALYYQHKLRAVDPRDSFGSISRLKHLRERLEDTKGKMLYAQVRTHLEHSEDLISRGDTVSAIPLLEEALTAQGWINSQFQGSSLEDQGEILRIRKTLEGLKTVDAVSQVEAYTGQGKVAYAEENWDEASRLFERAVVLQESINLNMPESNFVRWRLVQELKEYQRRIEAGRLNRRIEELISVFRAGGLTESLEQALKLQQTVNERFATTEFYNPDRFQELRRQLATDLSEANVALLLEQTEMLNAHIHDRDWGKVREALLELEGSLRDFESRFSLSLLPDYSLKDRVAWLIHLGSRHKELVDTIDGGLVDHPSLDMKLFHTEVDQVLFEIVMDANPSRWVGAQFPVDSVGFEEAAEFCNRISWALGQPVVLPDIRWMSFVDLAEVPADKLWFTSTSQFRSQRVGTSPSISGFFDLYGNLAEWVLNDNEPGAVGLYGGSGADTLELVKAEPVKWVAQNFRSRWAGFRFCVLRIK